MKRLLCITANMNAGGAETFLMKMYRNLERNKYQMDFIVSYKGENFYSKEIEELGGKIFYITPKSKNLVKSFFDIIKIVKSNQYKYVIRVNEHSLSTIDLLAAKFGGAKVLAMRSSNANSGTKFKILLHKMFRFLPICIPNVKIAPSTEAAIYTFGKKQVNYNKVFLLKNGLDISKYSYSAETRNTIREKLKIEDKYVIGHVGRFNEQKNHEFLIDVFNELHKKNSKYELVLVGKGYLEDKIKNKVKELKIEKYVHFLGERKDVRDLLMAFDLFVFPSFYEGMPNAVIEAQSTGLKCIVSDSITKEADVTGLVTFVKLEDSIDKWCTIIEDNINYNRIDCSKEMIKNGYDIKDVTKEFERVIFKDK